jgi:hypothetical protein
MGRFRTVQPYRSRRWEWSLVDDDQRALHNRDALCGGLKRLALLSEHFYVGDDLGGRARRDGRAGDIRVLEEEGDCIVCLEMRADELMRRPISGKLTNYRVVRTRPEPLQERAKTEAKTVRKETMIAIVGRRRLVVDLCVGWRSRKCWLMIN